MIPNYATAWREILERIFDGFTLQESVTPDWLVNPETGRRLKLDRFYPEAAIGFRLVGSTGKRKAPRSEQELEEEARRDSIREQLCRNKGVTLIAIHVYESEPRDVLRDIRSALSRSARVLAQSDHPHETKAALAPRLSKAKRVCDGLAARVRRTEDLALYSELWEDRQHAPPPKSPETPVQGARRHAYSVGQRVHHHRFGEGSVIDVRPSRADHLVVVRFDDGSERSFAASLVQSKLTPVK